MTKYEELDKEYEHLARWLGPQYAGDDDFTRQMRRHQSWWRAFVLCEPPGTGPKKTDTAVYGNMFQADAAEDGDNFLTEHIWEVVQERISPGASGVEYYRCLYNLLSSQPMCFNLFGELRGRHDLARDLLGALLPGEIGEVEEVIIEWAPEPRERYLDDHTAFDTFVRYRRATDGTPAFLAIETKLTEPFSPKEYDRPSYQQVTEQPGSPWKQETRGQLPHKTWNQLWRNHMLAVALANDPDSPFTHGIPIVIHHPDDQRAKAAIEGYRELLVDPDSLRSFDLREIVDAWRPLVTSRIDREWIDRFDLRYVQVDRSERSIDEGDQPARLGAPMIDV